MLKESRSKEVGGFFLCLFALCPDMIWQVSLVFLHRHHCRKEKLQCFCGLDSVGNFTNLCTNQLLIH